jgi:hypothetical protein
MVKFFGGGKKAAAAPKPAVSLNHYDVIVAPHITEKTTLLSEHNAVVFKVRPMRPSRRSRRRWRPCSGST